MEKKKENKNFVEKNKKQVIAIALALVLIIGGTYAWLTLTLNGTKTTRLEAGTLALELDETASEGINITDALPMSDTDGLATTAYTFSLKNTGTVTSDYTIYLDDVAISEDDERLADSVVKYSLTTNGGEATTALVSTLGTNPNRILTTGSIARDTTNTYTLKLWIDSSATNSDVSFVKDGSSIGKVFNANLRIEAGQEAEDTTSSQTGA